MSAGSWRCTTPNGNEYRLEGWCPSGIWYDSRGAAEYMARHDPEDIGGSYSMYAPENLPEFDGVMCLVCEEDLVPVGDTDQIVDQHCESGHRLHTIDGRLSATRSGKQFSWKGQTGRYYGDPFVFTRVCCKECKEVLLTAEIEPPEDNWDEVIAAVGAHYCECHNP